MPKKKAPVIPIGVRLVLIVLGIVVVVMLMSLLKNMVILPLVNKAWLKNADERCLGDDATALCSQTVGVVTVCNGHAEDTATQVRQIIKRAWCPKRIVVVVVQFGPLLANKQERTPTVSQLVTQHPLFMGIELEFNVSERIIVVQVEKVPTSKSVLQGNIVAMGIGLQKLRELKVNFACFMGPTAQPTKDWDNIALEEFEMAAEGGKHRPVLSYAPIKMNMASPTYPILAFQGPHPSLNWHQFRHAPSKPHPNKLLSSDFVFTRVNFLPDALEKTLVQFPCPPRFADILLSQLVLSNKMRIFAPCRLVVNGRFSTNCTRYLAQMSVNKRAFNINSNTTKAVMTVLQAPQLEPFVNTFLGLNMQSRTVDMHSAMGSLPHTAGVAREVLEEDLHLKFDNTENFHTTWGLVQRHVAITPTTGSS